VRGSSALVAAARGPVAVKVIDDRGNELMVVRKLSETEAE
jgi:hypothetical protein